MGAAASRASANGAAAATAAAARTAAVRSAAPKAVPDAPSAATTTPAAVAAKPPSGTGSPRRDEWAKLLRDVSGSIESHDWDRLAGNAQRAPNDAHPAARAAAVKSKLPKKRSRQEDVDGRVEGFLNQAQVVALYKLVRSDPEHWNADRLADNFKVDRQDVEALLQHTRTYTAHRGEDGLVRAFYDVGSEEAIERFEDRESG